MIHALLVTAVLLNAQPPVQALADARLVNVRDGAADLWLALEAQPGQLEAQSGEGLVELAIDGGACGAREIIAPAGRPVARISLAPLGDDGCTLRVEGRWETASVHLAEGGVLIALEGVAVSSAAPMPVAMAQGAARPDVPVRPTAAGERPDTAQQGAAQAPARGAPTALSPSPAGVCADTARQLDDMPWDLAAMAAHGDCLAAAGETAGAETLYARVLAFEPGHFAAALGLARIRAGTGDAEAARELFQTAAGAARTDGEALAARTAAEALRPDAD
ncbi:MAG: tetratricopeptide repeat protein [Glycocaulis sp.]